ncbi:MAG: 50S ribosomal protein L3 [Spartobacteria bacterium]|nr:50S ribosomal protein L3 [Spartobacteria bacterium]
MNGLIGKKVGMAQVFDEDGRQIPVTVLQVGPCVVVQKKTMEADGYEAVQLGFGEQKSHRLTKPLTGHFKKNELDAMHVLREVRLGAEDAGVKVGDSFSADLFEGISHVDVIGKTKGRGFQGVMKRHGMGGGRASHGSGTHRRPGSVGQCESPARIFKNKKMPGQLGNTRVTAQNLKIVQVRPEDNCILVHGSVPGPTGGILFVRKSIKKAAKAS